MTNKNGSDFLNRIAGFKIRIKELHWNARTTDEHELCDKITDKLNDIQDETAEELQALYGNIKPGDTNVKLPTATTTKAFIDELHKCIEEYYKQTLDDIKLVGINSHLKEYISDDNIFMYLEKMATVKEGKRAHNVMITEAQAQAVADAKIRAKLNESDGDVTGIYRFGKNSVYVNESNSMIAVKDVNKNILFENQGENIKALINLLKQQGKLIENQGGFGSVLGEWLKRQNII